MLTAKMFRHTMMTMMIVIQTAGETLPSVSQKSMTRAAAEISAQRVMALWYHWFQLDIVSRVYHHEEKGKRTRQRSQERGLRNERSTGG